LILLWTGKFKGLDKGTGQYHRMPKVWEAVGITTATSGSIPSAFGARPPNVCNNKMACTWIRGHFGCFTLVQFFSQNDFNEGFTLTTLLNLLNSFTSVSSLKYLHLRFQPFKKAFKTGFSNMSSRTLILSMGFQVQIHHVSQIVLSVFS